MMDASPNHSKTLIIGVEKYNILDFCYVFLYMV